MCDLRSLLPHPIACVCDLHSLFPLPLPCVCDHHLSFIPLFPVCVTSVLSFLTLLPVCVTSILSFLSLFPVCVTTILSFLPPYMPPFSSFSQVDLSYQVEVQCSGFESSLGECNVTEVPTSSSCSGFMSAAGVSCNTGKRSHPPLLVATVIKQCSNDMTIGQFYLVFTAIPHLVIGIYCTVYKVYFCNAWLIYNVTV